MKDETIYIRIGGDLRARLDRESGLRGEALSVIVREALREYFEDKPHTALRETSSTRDGIAAKIVSIVAKEVSSRKRKKALK